MKHCRYIVPGIAARTGRTSRRRWALIEGVQRGQCGRPATHQIMSNALEALCPIHAKAWEKLFGEVENLAVQPIAKHKGVF